MSMNISRRSFMKGAAASSLAVAASTLLTGCSMPNLGDIFGSLGSRKGSFTIGNTTVDITLKNCQYVSYYKEIIPTFEVKNNTDTNVTFAKKATSGSGYQIVPVFTYAGEDWTLDTKVPGTSLVAAGTTETLDLIGRASLNQWTGAKLTLTLHKDGKPEGDPIVFNLTK